ncbi:HPr(Ser) kinase/phosphatase [uncultured Tyzzerella sp.]|uniref:HPr(Ser) kinase/phosphatase n=1 Tax=uncultured Tyzzerella sp. TaxID=2321398 RepID=UPI0029428B28|nr:HPr(Ser) kinase/phosphatase [uncultured Tyzzerella sp.]
MYSVKIEQLVKEYELKNLTPNVDFSGKILCHPEVNRPALQLAGFFEYFSSERIQIIGLVEHSYIATLPNKEKQEIFEKICSYKVPCIVLCRELQPPQELLDAAIKHSIPVFQTKDSTSEFESEVIRWLRVQLAPRVTMHGVLVDIYGEGVLIIGESGVGKSETALELIKRGHRLVADDAVEIKKVSHNTLVGSCPEIIRYFIELRGIGIINVKQMFGVQSVKDTQGIDLIIKLEPWEKGKQYDRLGLNEEYMDILGNEVVCQTLPIRPGRNLAMICESAAVNRRQKKMGYNAAQALNERIIKNMEN